MPTSISVPPKSAAAANVITFEPTTSISSTQVQNAIAELAAETVDLSTNQTIGGVKSFSGGELALINATRNLLSFNSAGAATPTFTARSAGTKVLLSPALAAAATDYAVGIASNNLWQSIPQAINTQFFRWYGGTTELAFLRGDGVFFVPKVGVNTPTPGPSMQVAGGVAITSGTAAAADPGSGSLSVQNTLTAGAIRRGIITIISGDYYIGLNESVIFLQANSNNVLIYVPSVVNSAGRLLRFIRTDNSSNTATISTLASNQLINGSMTLSLTTQYAVVDLECNGSSWFIA